MTLLLVIGAAMAAAFLAESLWALEWPQRLARAGQEAVTGFGERRRRAQACRQWPQALLFLSGAVAAGATLDDALVHLSREAPEPLRSRVRHALEGPSLTTEARVRRLMDEPLLRFARAALLLYLRTGGRVGRLLETTAAVLQERVEAEARVNALTAQGRVSAWIVALTPFGLGGALALLAPDLAAPLLHTALGRLVLMTAGVLVALGLFLAQKLARVEA